MTDRAHDRLPSDLKVIATYCRRHTVEIERLTAVVRRYIAPIAIRFDNVDTADDLIQEAMLHIQEQCSKHFRPRGNSFLWWAAKVAENRFIDLARKKRKDVLRSAVPHCGGGEHEQELPIADSRPRDRGAWLRAFVKILRAAEPDPRKRRAFMAYYHDREDVDSIVSDFGVAPKTVRNWRSCTLKRLRKYGRRHNIDFEDLDDGLL